MLANAQLTLARSLLQKIFGFSSFKENQVPIIESILSGRDVFAALPTGGGKSLCYQLPAAMSAGLTVVISPLVALMKDQVDAVRETGVGAAFLNSTQTYPEAAAVHRSLDAGKLKLLYISPERFASESFVDRLASLEISLFAVDEAHCISEWGHDFRPDYLSLQSIRQRFPATTIAAFTATATLKVQDDIIGLLGLNDPFVLRASFDRKELYYKVIAKLKPDKQILEFVAQRPSQSGIIYRTSRSDVERTAAMLRSAGFKALPYHAGLPTEERVDHQERFNTDEADIIVATIAFGMGIDKPNIRYVVHGDLPKSLDGYYQETGRAGRDGSASDCLLLYGAGDIMKVKYHIEKMRSSEEQAKAENNLRRMAAFATALVCRRVQLLEHFGQVHPGSCGQCDVCTGDLVRTDATVDARMIMSAIVRTGERFGAVHIIDIVTGADNEKVRRYHHDELPTWGVGRAKSKPWWRAVVDELIAQKWLSRDAERYNALITTNKGRDLLHGTGAFYIIRVENSDVDASTTPDSTRASQNPIPGAEPDPRLLAELRDFRNRIARKKSVPAYIIFSDKTLREMAVRNPQTLESMLGVTGIGDKKLAQYGRAFLDVLRGAE